MTPFFKWKEVEVYDSPRPKMGNLAVLSRIAALKHEEKELEKERKSPVASLKRTITDSVIEPQRRSSRKRCSKRSYSNPDFKINQKKSKSSTEKPTAKKKKKVDVPLIALPNPPPDMPEELKDRIKAVNGTEAIMVIQKRLTSTDLKRDHCRLSIPFGKINRGFLREDEREVLAKQVTWEVPFMEPSQKVSSMAFRQWDMPKTSGKKSSMYVIKTYWNDVVKANDLHENDIVQIWSFRVGGDQQQLCLALVVVSRAPNVDGHEEDGVDGGR